MAPQIPVLTAALRLLTQSPQTLELLLPLLLAGALGDEELHAETGTVYICDPLAAIEAGRLVAGFATRVYVTNEGRVVEDRNRPPGLQRFEESDGSVAGWVLANGISHVAPDCPSCEFYKKSPSEPQFKSLMCSPIIHGRTIDDKPRIIGLFNLHNKQAQQAWTDEYCEFVEPWTHIAALAIRAIHNELTMLPNRSLTEHLLTSYMNGSSAPNDDLCLAYLDLDGFGKVNAEFGHRPADEVLVRFAGLLKDSVGTGIDVCHMHGDEFVLIIRERSGDEAVARVETILAYVRENQGRLRVGGKVVEDAIGATLTSTAGIARWSLGMDPKQLIDAAETANREQKIVHRGGVLKAW